jgi:hypothetical protein
MLGRTELNLLEGLRHIVYIMKPYSGSEYKHYQSNQKYSKTMNLYVKTYGTKITLVLEFNI